MMQSLVSQSKSMLAVVLLFVVSSTSVKAEMSNMSVSDAGVCLSLMEEVRSAMSSVKTFNNAKQKSFTETTSQGKSGGDMKRLADFLHEMDVQIHNEYRHVANVTTIFSNVGCPKDLLMATLAVALEKDN
ncbi:hypothetical protein ACMXYO_15375 [Neptuniibacter sp. QD37_6]|uniref:hypothetical protein n=1 Tax=Neptuniibacter sp. QD37_6 TaxID=3398210 RepID=UPI0039F52A95